MNETKATRYQRLRRRAHVAGTAAGGLTVALVALSPAARALAGWSRELAAGLGPGPREAVAVCGMVVVLVAAWELAALPAMAYLARRANRRYAPGEASFEEVLIAQAQAALVVLPVFAGVALVWRGSTALAGGWWWAAAGVTLAGLSGLALRGAPRLLAGLAPAAPLDDPALAARLDAIARRAGVPLHSVDEWRVGAASGRSALVTGGGRGVRVLLASELVRDWSHDEIAVVVAHEIAHHRHRDLWRAIALDAALVCLAALAADRTVAAFGPALGLNGPSDLAALPLIALAGGGAWLAATPLRHAQSRQHERRADALALALTGGADAFSAAVRRLGERYLVEEQPSTLTRWLFHSHPSIADRLALADAYRRARRRAL
jgi:STE24 endopeptidase